MKAVGRANGDSVSWLGDRKPADNTMLYVENPYAPEKKPAIIGYTLEPIYETPPGAIVTQAFILCQSCGGSVSSTSGPRYNAVCLKCVEHFDVISKLIQKGN